MSKHFVTVGKNYFYILFLSDNHMHSYSDGSIREQLEQLGMQTGAFGKQTSNLLISR